MRNKWMNAGKMKRGGKREGESIGHGKEDETEEYKGKRKTNSNRLPGVCEAVLRYIMKAEVSELRGRGKVERRGRRGEYRRKRMWRGSPLYLPLIPTIIIRLSTCAGY